MQNIGTKIISLCSTCYQKIRSLGLNCYNNLVKDLSILTIPDKSRMLRSLKMYRQKIVVISVRLNTNRQSERIKEYKL